MSENATPATTELHPSITLDRVMAAVERDENEGFCTSCGEETHGAEPDATDIECEACGAARVHGAEELLLMLGI